MKAYRIAHKMFIGDLSGTGAKMYGGRWNPVGTACVYTSEHFSLALLEKMVHAQSLPDMRGLSFLSFEFADENEIYRIDISKMKKNWETDFIYTQWLGQQILEQSTYKAFAVPSIIVSSEWNIIINPAALNSEGIKTSKPESFHIDERLLAKFPETIDSKR